ncbi:MAG TPA: phosphatase PAP2 family protein [Planctomycetota bacterium]|nr:phosphatase PAP2 family protein [Planctomycetota bacterium]
MPRKYDAGGRLQISHGRAVFAALVLVLASGCASDRFRRHLDGEIWGDAVAEQWENPWRAVPEATLLATSLALIPTDDEIQKDFSEEDPGKNAALPGDILEYCAIGVPLLWGGMAWSKGDRGEELETAAEALAMTGLSTLLLKGITNRERPDGSSQDSFPSGHTAAAFCGATLLADFIEKDLHSRLGYLLYVPAAYVGINRIQVDRHWATDVAAGAFLGTLVANLLFDLHFGDASRGHEGVFGGEEARWSIGPEVTDHGAGVLVHADF